MQVIHTDQVSVDRLEPSDVRVALKPLEAGLRQWDARQAAHWKSLGREALWTW